MANIEWRHTIPSEGSLVGIGDDDIRHQKRQLEALLNESHSIGDDDNPVKPNAALPIYAAVSAVSCSAASYGEVCGKLFIASDETRVYSCSTRPTVGVSVNTMIGLVGTEKLIENADTIWPRATWVERSDWTTVGSDSAVTIEDEYTIDYGMSRGWSPQGIQSGYDGIPTVFITAQSDATTSNNQGHTVQVTDVQRDKFKFRVQRISMTTGVDSALTVQWTSLGTIAGNVGGTY